MNEIIGFTGTSDGMTFDQINQISKIIQALKPREVHHGDCIGADSQFHDICLDNGIKIFIHPPNNDKKRAFRVTGEMNYFTPAPYLKRNHQIVDICNILIAAPKKNKEELRSGTWATVRYAIKTNREVKIVYPDGKEMNIKQFVGGFH